MANKYEEYTYDPNIMVDNDADKARLEGIKKRWEETSARGNLIKFVYRKVTYGTRASVVNVSDIHGISSEASRTKMILGDNGFIAKTVTDWVCPGEVLDGMVEKHHDGNANEGKGNFNEEVDLIRPLIAPIASKCCGMTGATHDDPETGKRLKATYLAPTRQLAHELKIPFGIRAVFIEYSLPVFKGNIFLGYKPSWVVVVHGEGASSSKRLNSAEKTFNYVMALVEQVNQKCGTSITPDWIFGGHFHADVSEDKSVVRFVRDAKGKATGSYVHTVRIRSGGTLKAKDSDSFNSGFYGEYNTNARVYNWYLEENRDFQPNKDNNAAQYTVMPTEFNILSKKNNSYTAEAQKYCSVREDAEVQKKVQTKYAEASTKDLIDIFEGRGV